MTQIIPDIINIVIEAIFAILGLFFTGVAIPWLVKTGIPWLKDKRLYGIVTVLVKAAEKQREAVVLHYLGGLTAKAIAERTSAPLPTVKSRLKSARRALAEYLRED